LNQRRRVRRPGARCGHCCGDCSCSYAAARRRRGRGHRTGRGDVAARVAYGNKASVLGGDHLLVCALQLVQQLDDPRITGELLETVESMVDSEALQLSRRGSMKPDREIYLRILQGKTASLFRWCFRAGGLLAGMDDDGLSDLAAQSRKPGSWPWAIPMRPWMPFPVFPRAFRARQLRWYWSWRWTGSCSHDSPRSERVFRQVFGFKIRLGLDQECVLMPPPPRRPHSPSPRGYPTRCVPESCRCGRRRSRGCGRIRRASCGRGWRRSP